MMPSLNQFKRFDVRPVIAAGEDPFPQIIARLKTPPAGSGLLLIAPFLPSPLIEKLGADGYCSRIEHTSGGEWRVYFWREES